MDYKLPYREQNSNKGSFGKVLNFAGSKNYIGAAFLSTAAVLKSGAGFCALASEKDIIRSVSALLPEAVYLSSRDGLEQIQNFSVVLIGCGLGNNERLFRKVLEGVENLPIIIDADGLNILAKLDKKRVFEAKRLTPHPNPLLKERELNIVITPHPLEAARLLGVSLETILSDLEGSAVKLTEKYNCITVLKTHRTIICSKDEMFINRHGNSALAKAGSGDVLAGIIAGLTAQKMNIFEAAKLGVYLHSRAGEIASEELTEYSVLASELLKYLPFAIKELL